MAISRYNTYRLLNVYPRVMGVNIWYWNQVSGMTGNDEQVGVPGEFIFVQPERDIIVQGLLVADRLILQELGFAYRPRFFTEKAYYSPYNRRVQTKYRHVHAIGKRATALLQANASVTYSDSTGDGVNDLATVSITVTTPITDLTEVQAFFRVVDKAPKAADERYEIEPLTVSASTDGLTLTLTGHRALFVKPSLWATAYNSPNHSNASKVAGSTDTADSFITAVDVYRVYPDASDYGSAHILDGEQGWIDFRGGSTPYCDSLGRTEISYYAGYPLDLVTGLAEPTLELAYVRLANAKMPIEPTNFDDPRANVWNLDWSTWPAGTLPQRFMENPFGVKTGEVASWQLIRSFLGG